MSKPTFPAAKRTEFGSKAAQRYRADGQVPLTISRRGQDSEHVLVGTKDADALKGLVSHVVLLQLDGQDREVLIKQFDRDPIADHVLHIDGIEVADDQVVEVAIPVVPDTRGDCPGIKAGGLVEQMLRKVTIRCQAGSIPDHLNVGLQGIGLGQTVYAEAVSLPADARLITKPRTALLTIVKTRGMRRAEATGAAEAEGGA